MQSSTEGTGAVEPTLLCSHKALIAQWAAATLYSESLKQALFPPACEVWNTPGAIACSKMARPRGEQTSAQDSHAAAEVSEHPYNTRQALQVCCGRGEGAGKKHQSKPNNLCVAEVMRHLALVVYLVPLVSRGDVHEPWSLARVVDRAQKGALGGL